jgi:hypothetical protein
MTQGSLLTMIFCPFLTSFMPKLAMDAPWRHPLGG